MTTLQEAARKALKALEVATTPVAKDRQEVLTAMCDLRTALAQQREQQPVCRGCGIPAGDVHMSTCKSGKWPSRVSNGDTAAPAPQAQEPARQPAPDCRTCSSLDEDEVCARKRRGMGICINGNQYQPAPALVLWRTE